MLLITLKPFRWWNCKIVSLKQLTDVLLVTSEWKNSPFDEGLVFWKYLWMTKTGMQLGRYLLIRFPKTQLAARTRSTCATTLPTFQGHERIDHVFCFWDSSLAEHRATASKLVIKCWLCFKLHRILIFLEQCLMAKSKINKIANLFINKIICNKNAETFTNCQTVTN